jgi:hypothetical protein
MVVMTGSLLVPLPYRFQSTKTKTASLSPDPPIDLLREGQGNFFRGSIRRGGCRRIIKQIHKSELALGVSSGTEEEMGLLRGTGTCGRFVFGRMIGSFAIKYYR